MAEDLNLKTIETVDTKPFKHLVMTIGELPTSFVESMTYYELLAWLCNYLQETVIPTVNNNAEAVEELQGLFTELKNYVDNYFDNLDVQEEINNKLDDMARDGSLSAVLAVYVNPQLDQIRNELNTETYSRRNEDANLQNQINVLVDRPTVSPSVPTKTSQLINDSGFVKGESYSVHGSGSDITLDGTSDEALIIQNVFGNLEQKDTPTLGIPADIDVVTGTQTVNISGKNMFDIESLDATNISVVDKVASGTSGAFSIAYGISTSGISLPTYDGEAGSLGISATAYTDGNATTQANGGLFIRVYYTDNSYDNAMIWSNSDTSPVRKTFVTNSEKTISKITIAYENNASNIWHISKFQIEKGGVSDYSDYIGQTINIRLGSIELAKIGNYVDYIYTDGTKFYKHSLIGKVVLDGSETWTKTNNAFQTPATTTPNYRLSSTIVAYSNYFNYHYYPSGITTNIQDGEFGWSGASVLSMRNDDCVDATAFQTWLGTHNTSIYYVISTATDTEITDTDLLDDLAELWNAKGGSVETDIKVTATSLPAGLIVSQYVNRYAPATTSRIGGVIIGEGIEVTANGTISVPASTEIFNSSPYLQTPDWKVGAKAYDAHMNLQHQNIEAFTFFTDPHLASNGTNFSDRTNKWIGTLQKYYNSTPQNFIVCGGDWLNEDTTVNDAIFKLGYVDGFMNSMFKNYYGLVGNHDKDTHGAGNLAQSTINNLLYRKEGKAYYSFDGVKTKCYCLDTGDASATMNTYRWTQIDWLGDSLLTDDPEHAIVFMHVIWNVIPGGYSVLNMADNVTKLINAYNTHTTITLNSKTYDFTNCTGKVHYVLGGHTHYDHTDNVNGVLCIVTATFSESIQSQPTFDMIINDYQAGKAYFNRIGNGSSAEYNI